MSTPVIATVFEHPDSGGLSQTACVAGAGRYYRIPWSTLASGALAYKLSSARALSSPDTHTALMLFSTFFIPSLQNYAGRFLQVTNASSGADLNVNFADHSFDDSTTSILLAATRPGEELRLSFRNLFLAKWNTMITTELGTDARQEGDPLLTWEMFPEGMAPLDPSSIYLKIHQPVTIILSGWYDYAASITYHVQLYVDAGRVRGYVARWSFWVDDGVKHDQIVQQFGPKVAGGAATLNTELTSNLARLDGLLTVKDIYYLPGRQFGTTTGVSTGFTWDDTTIVLVY